MDTIEFKGAHYPKLQSEGFAAQYAFPFANKILKGTGVDIGCNRHEWCLPGAIPIDPAIEGCEYDAYNLGPHTDLDFVFTSHCAEHLSNYVDAINYWNKCLKDGGILFMYLPHCEYQAYWKPWHNRKHIHYLTPDLMFELLTDTGWNDVFVTQGYDVNGSFYAIATK